MTLEQVIRQHTEHDAERFDELREELKAMREDVAIIRDTVARQKGFVAGAIFVVGALFAAASAFIGWLK